MRKLWVQKGKTEAIKQYRYQINKESEKLNVSKAWRDAAENISMGGLSPAAIAYLAGSTISIKNARKNSGECNTCLQMMKTNKEEFSSKFIPHVKVMPHMEQPSEVFSPVPVLCNFFMKFYDSNDFDRCPMCFGTCFGEGRRNCMRYTCTNPDHGNDVKKCVDSECIRLYYLSNLGYKYNTQLKKYDTNEFCYTANVDKDSIEDQDVQNLISLSKKHPCPITGIPDSIVSQKTDSIFFHGMTGGMLFCYDSGTNVVLCDKTAKRLLSTEDTDIKSSVNGVGNSAGGEKVNLLMRLNSDKNLEKIGNHEEMWSEYIFATVINKENAVGQQGFNTVRSRLNNSALRRLFEMTNQHRSDNGLSTFDEASFPFTRSPRQSCHMLIPLEHQTGELIFKCQDIFVIETKFRTLDATKTKWVPILVVGGIRRREPRKLLRYNRTDDDWFLEPPIFNDDDFIETILWSEEDEFEQQRMKSDDLQVKEQKKIRTSKDPGNTLEDIVFIAVNNKEVSRKDGNSPNDVTAEEIQATVEDDRIIATKMDRLDEIQSKAQIKLTTNGPHHIDTVIQAHQPALMRGTATKDGNCFFESVCISTKSKYPAFNWTKGQLRSAVFEHMYKISEEHGIQTIFELSPLEYIRRESPNGTYIDSFAISITEHFLKINIIIFLVIGGDQMVAPVTRLENTVHYERTIYLAHHQNHYEPLVPKLGFDWSFERTNLHPVINTVEDQTSCGAITLGQKPINLVEKLNLNRNLADDFNILQEKIVKDSQGFIKVVSSKRKKKSNQTSVQNSASIPGSQFNVEKSSTM